MDVQVNSRKSLDIFGLFFCICLSSPMPFHAVGVTSVVKWSIFVQGKERGVEQHRVVVLHDNPLVLCLDPWLVLIG